MAKWPTTCLTSPAGILNTLPYFLLALLITVLGELATLWLYLHMANQAFAYDVALIGRFIRNRCAYQVEYGEVMQRFDGDFGILLEHRVLFSLPLSFSVCSGHCLTLAHNGSPCCLR